MKQIFSGILIVIGIVTLLLITACFNSTVDTPRLTYNLVSSDKIPDVYSDGLLSVKGFLKVKDNYVNKTVTVRGMVVYKSECPICPPNAKCAPCTIPMIEVADPVNDADPTNPLMLNIFPKNFNLTLMETDPGLKSVKPGDLIDVTFQYKFESVEQREYQRNIYISLKKIN